MVMGSAGRPETEEEEVKGGKLSSLATTRLHIPLLLSLRCLQNTRHAVMTPRDEWEVWVEWRRVSKTIRG